MRWLFLVLLLAGCAGPGLRPVDSGQGMPTAAVALGDFRLDGRLSVRDGERAVSGTLSWQRTGGADLLLLSGPLGQGAAEIRREAGRSELRMADGTRIEAEDDEQLMARVLGLRLPLDGWGYWLSGQPRPGAGFHGALDGQGRLAWLEQGGWHIEYDRYARDGGRWLPGRIVARYGDEVDFRFVADRWELK